ncbi:MAG: WYL domain-containing protein, partial [Emcibacteraceae bacterium]|nr:WYL domain-containing protein [Emcibacteraceae bacterium]
AIRHKNKLNISYRDANDIPSERIIWPIAIAYYETVRLIITWCEKRNDFRHFRTDRINSWETLDNTFTKSVSALRKEWWVLEKCKSTL